MSMKKEGKRKKTWLLVTLIVLVVVTTTTVIPIMLVIGWIRGVVSYCGNGVDQPQMQYNYTITDAEYNNIVKHPQVDNNGITHNILNDREKLIVREALELGDRNELGELNATKEGGLEDMETMWNYLESKYPNVKFSPVGYEPAEFNDAYRRGWFNADVNGDTLVTTVTMTIIKKGYGLDDDFPYIMCKDEFTKEISGYLTEHFKAEDYKIAVSTECSSSNDYKAGDTPNKLIKDGMVYGEAEVVFNENACSSKELSTVIREYSKWLYSTGMNTHISAYVITDDKFKEIGIDDIPKKQTNYQRIESYITPNAKSAKMEIYSVVNDKYRYETASEDVINDGTEVSATEIPDEQVGTTEKYKTK